MTKMLSNELNKNLIFSAQIDYLQLFGEICRQKGYMSIPTLIKGKSNVPPRNIRHWDQNYIFSVFCHHGYVFVL